MKAKWESFNLTHRHLPSDELEREWAKSFAASKDVDLKAELSRSVSKNASIFGQRTSPKPGEQASRAVAGEAFWNPYQGIHRRSISSIHEANGNLPQAAPPVVHCNRNSIFKRVNNPLEALSSEKQLILYRQNNHPTLHSDHRLFTSVEIRSEPTKEITSSRDYGGSKVSCTSSLTTLSSQSLSARTRPWDL